MPSRIVLSFLALALSVPVLSQTPAADERLGAVHFATSCDPAGAPAFDRAVALLNSFEFAAAIGGFEHVLARDSSCAMAHWGIALSRWGNPVAAGNRPAKQLALGRAAANAALARGVGATDRERQYITAVSRLYDDFEHTTQRSRFMAYERAMARLRDSYPADTEAAIFHAIALVASADPADRTYASQRAAGKLLEQLRVAKPDHPGLAHYIIHAYDYPALARRGSAAAATYASIAPSAAHALHMPSHIFTRTGEWRESIRTNVRSMKIAEGNGSIAEALHAADYAEYAYLQLGLDSPAGAIVHRLSSLASKFDPDRVTGAAPGSAGVFALAAIPARFALERGQWRAAAKLEPRPSSFPWTQAMTYFARAIGSARTGNLADTRAAIDSLASIHRRLTELDESYWAGQVAIQQLGASAWLSFAEGRADSAIILMRQAAAIEDATDKNAVTPGPLAPAREMLGDLLMEYHRPAEALREYRLTLEKEPNRRRAIRGALAADQRIRMTRIR
ncbi:MAG: hypothetical protein ABIS03_13515 [Gemmatimonadaceae bacterium]